MDLRLKPETEAKIREGIERGPYRTAEELIEQAISEFLDREDYLAQHRAEIAQKIEEGWQSAKQGRLMSAEEVKSAMATHKAAWLKAHQKE